MPSLYSATLVDGGPSLTSSCILLLLAALPCFVIGKAIYNVFFHPLRRFPGPKSYAVNNVPWAYMMMSGQAPRAILRMHEKYGDVVRIGPGRLAFRSAQAWQDIMGHRKGARPEMGKDPYFFATTDFHAQSIIFSDRETHTRFRRVLSRGFSDKAMKEQEPLIKGYVDLLVQRLHENLAKGPLDMTKWYNWTTFDIIGDLTYGEPFNCLNDSSYHPWVSLMFDRIKAVAFQVSTRRFGLVTRGMKWVMPKSLMRARLGHIEMVKEKVNKRIEQGPVRPDFMGKILEQEGDKGMSLAEMQANASVLMVAGSETTATTLSGVTYLLLKNPAAMEKLVHEVRSTFQHEDEITLVSVGHLQYMLACLEEALRVYPPVPTALPRSVPKGGDYIDGNFVPEGTSVGIFQWAVNHSPSLFKEPDSFRPERFLGDPSFQSDTKEALQPFHYGPRACLGRNLAIAEMRLILAKVIYHFDLSLDPSSEDWMDQASYLLWQKGALKVYLTPAKQQ